MSVDPIKSGLNWYEYCYSNPATLFDPDGLTSVRIDKVIDYAITQAKNFANETRINIEKWNQQRQEEYKREEQRLREELLEKNRKYEEDLNKARKEQYQAKALKKYLETFDRDWKTLKEEMKATKKWQEQKKAQDEIWKQMDEIRISLAEEKEREREKKAQEKKIAEETNRARGLIGVPDPEKTSNAVHDFFQKLTCEVQSVLRAVVDYAGLGQLGTLLNGGTISEWNGDALSLDIHRVSLEERRESAIGAILDILSVKSPTAGFLNALYSLVEMDPKSITLDTTSWLASIIVTEEPYSNYVTKAGAFLAAKSAISEIYRIYEPSKDFYTIVSFRSDGTTSQYKYYIDEEHSVKELKDEHYVITGTIPANYRHYYEMKPFPDLSISLIDKSDVRIAEFRFS